MRGPALQPIVIAAGGTGGHFFPAEALADELVARGHRVVLMTDARAAGKLPVSFAEREVFVLRGAGIAGRGLRRGASAVTSMAAGVVQARRILSRLDPLVVVGFGGYPSVAPIVATRLMRQVPPVIVHEQNAVLGRANRLLCRTAAVLALSFESTSRVPRGVRTVVTGNPVRSGFNQSETFTRYTTRDTRILVVGGSQGARVFADEVPRAIASLPDELRRGLHVIQQCRPEDLERVRNFYRQHNIAAELSPFFDNMPAHMLSASLIIGRAGASTVAELRATARHAILIPLPNAIDDHQMANARALEAEGFARVVPQHQIATLGACIAEALSRNETSWSEARTAAFQSAIQSGGAAARLADLVLQHAQVRA